MAFRDAMRWGGGWQRTARGGGAVKKISLSLLSSVDNQSFLSALEEGKLAALGKRGPRSQPMGSAPVTLIRPDRESRKCVCE